MLEQLARIISRVRCVKRRRGRGRHTKDFSSRYRIDDARRSLASTAKFANCNSTKKQRKFHVEAFPVCFLKSTSVFPVMSSPGFAVASRSNADTKFGESSRTLATAGTSKSDSYNELLFMNDSATTGSFQELASAQSPSPRPATKNLMESSTKTLQTQETASTGNSPVLLDDDIISPEREPSISMRSLLNTREESGQASLQKLAQLSPALEQAHQSSVTQVHRNVQAKQNDVKSGDANQGEDSARNSTSHNTMHSTTMHSTMHTSTMHSTMHTSTMHSTMHSPAGKSPARRVAASRINRRELMQRAASVPTIMDDSTPISFPGGPRQQSLSSYIDEQRPELDDSEAEDSTIDSDQKPKSERRLLAETMEATSNGMMSPLASSTDETPHSLEGFLDALITDSKSGAYRSTSPGANYRKRAERRARNNSVQSVGSALDHVRPSRTRGDAASRDSSMGTTSVASVASRAGTIAEGVPPPPPASQPVDSSPIAWARRRSARRRKGRRPNGNSPNRSPNQQGEKGGYGLDDFLNRETKYKGPNSAYSVGGDPRSRRSETVSIAISDGGDAKTFNVGPKEAMMIKKLLEGADQNDEPLGEELQVSPRRKAPPTREAGRMMSKNFLESQSPTCDGKPSLYTFLQHGTRTPSRSSAATISGGESRLRSSSVDGRRNSRNRPALKARKSEGGGRWGKQDTMFSGHDSLPTSFFKAFDFSSKDTSGTTGLESYPQSSRESGTRGTLQRTPSADGRRSSKNRTMLLSGKSDGADRWSQDGSVFSGHDSLPANFFRSFDYSEIDPARSPPKVKADAQHSLKTPQSASRRRPLLQKTHSVPVLSVDHDLDEDGRWNQSRSPRPTRRSTGADVLKSPRRSLSPTRLAEATAEETPKTPSLRRGKKKDFTDVSTEGRSIKRRSSSKSGRKRSSSSRRKRADKDAASIASSTHEKSDKVGDEAKGKKTGKKSLSGTSKHKKSKGKVKDALHKEDSPVKPTSLRSLNRQGGAQSKVASYGPNYDSDLDAELFDDAPRKAKSLSHLSSEDKTMRSPLKAKKPRKKTAGHSPMKSPAKSIKSKTKHSTKLPVAAENPENDDVKQAPSKPVRKLSQRPDSAQDRLQPPGARAEDRGTRLSSVKIAEGSILEVHDDFSVCSDITDGFSLEPSEIDAAKKKTSKSPGLGRIEENEKNGVDASDVSKESTSRSHMMKRWQSTPNMSASLDMLKSPTRPLHNEEFKKKSSNHGKLNWLKKKLSLKKT